MEERLLLPSEVAAILRCCKKTVYNKMHSGEIPIVEVAGIKRIKESWLTRELNRKKYEKKGCLA
jgi:hypothetical protein